jgi:FMN phosphatase YigB (HAD superfamily)
MKKKVLLIDLDGTLLGTKTLRLHVLFSFWFVHCLMSHKIGILEALKLLHQIKTKMRESWHQKKSPVNWSKAISFFSQITGRNKLDCEKILSFACLYSFKKANSALYPLENAISFIDWAKNHYRLILATNPMWPLEVVEYRLQIAGIDKNKFEFITNAGNMTAIKPYVEYYEELVTKLNLNPQDCLMIGNDEVKDGPARKIQIEVVIIEHPKDFIVLRSRLEKEML